MESKEHVVEAKNAIAARPLPATGILQPWVAELGLRYQGVLLSVIRGCDTESKHTPSKALTRALRGFILNTHCADPRQAKSFIEFVDNDELERRFDAAFDVGWDELPHHYVMHVMHAVEVLGYLYPERKLRQTFRSYYYTFCLKLHVNPESQLELIQRLEADESTFAAGQ